MPKDFSLESIRHLLLRALEKSREEAPREAREGWAGVAETLEISRGERASLVVRWALPRPGSLPVDPSGFKLYQRGDSVLLQSGAEDPAAANHRMADQVARQIGLQAGMAVPVAPARPQDRLRSEEEFHDRWAAGESPGQVLVRESFEAATAPENRLVLEIFGDLRGKRILDLGCGLGEGAVYFATRGAEVTACDLSAGMLDMASRVAALHGVKLAFQQSPAEATGLPGGSFDLVYAANLLHHVDTPRALDEIQRLLAPGGTFATWDPLAHNPVINVYRRMACAVRTADEHPLRMNDLPLFQSRFRDVQWRCFWLAAQAVFLRFYLWERVHPGRERYWKKILTDAARLEPFYRPLESLDRKVLKVLPWLERYCWNIVVWGRK